MKEWNLPKLKKSPLKQYRKNGNITLLAYSENILRKPSDWSRNEVITGFRLIDNVDEGILDKKLEKFLEKKPYYIGFGSMPIKNVQQTVSMIDKALELLQEHAVLYLSYNDRVYLGHSDRIYIVSEVPHSILFPRVKATVIHGGIGTCRASMMAGKPTFVIPFMGDQEFWGLQLHKIGLGPKPIKLKRLDAKLFAKKLLELQSDTYRKNAEMIKEKLSTEQGAEKAAQIIAELCNKK